MLLWQKTEVKEILLDLEDKQIVHLENDRGERRKGINYPQLTGKCHTGDMLFVNSTAVELKLGTGGFDFVIANLTHPPLERSMEHGHIMKNRYTPLQYAIEGGEERIDPDCWEIMEDSEYLHSIPVLIITLHSMLPILTLMIKESNPDMKIVYVMTDSTSLPIWLSEHVQLLKEMGLLVGTITCGQSFGGDIEAVNKFSAMLLAKYYYDADLIIIGSGPGSVGTGTKWGYSAIEAGELVNAVHILNGIPIVVPRISFCDRRDRHLGISHHLLTSLAQVALSSAHLPLPLFHDQYHDFINQQVIQAELSRKHQIHWMPTLSEDKIRVSIAKYEWKITTMGRDLDADPTFYQGVAAAAQYVITT